MFERRDHFRRAMWAVVVIAAMAIVSSVAGQGKVTQRPFSDFLDNQGTTSNFFPPCPDELGWVNNAPMTTFGWFDYTGQCAQVLGLDLGTTVTGTVTERRLRDGRALVQVNVHAVNAYAWARSYNWWEPGPTWFGYSPLDTITGNVGVGECHLKVVFYNEPGAPLPDLVALPYDRYVSMFFRGTAYGPLRAAFGVEEGTPGILTVSQTGFSSKPGNPTPTGDGWPAEVVDLTVIP